MSRHRYHSMLCTIPCDGYCSCWCHECGPDDEGGEGA